MGVPSDFLKNLTTSLPEAIEGSSGIYHLYSQSESGNKIFLQIGLAACPGRKDGTTYHAVGLLIRVLYAGDEPTLPEHFENRGQRAYKKVPGGDEVYCHQLNKMLFPVATVNIGSQGMVEASAMHLEAFEELMGPLLEANGQLVKFTPMSIFEAQNPQMMMPVVNFPVLKTIKSWEETLAEIKAASTAGYKPKGDPLPDADKA